MEVQLQELIEQIKKDGVAAAEAEAKTIVEAAQADAEKILADAQAQAEKMLADAKAETERMTRSSEDAIRQAGRNLLISFRESVARELKTIVGENVGAVYASDAFGELILRIVENWANTPDAEEIAVILNTQDLNQLEETALAALKEKLSKGITLKANDHFDGGFRIAVNEGGAYYDYSAEAVAEMLSNYLSPKVTELLKEAE
ncbi:MAG: V-type ATP synthase subunit E [Clostridia bacterium]|nr:V-type ATP synthase subunit E [Clostridia bacterium]MBR4086722.1 V-type ATP synthase subunit E [Clostridia bacterium]